MSQKKRKSSEQQLHNKDEKVARTVTVPLDIWEKFERFQEYLPQLKEISSELRSNWKDHLRYLTEEFQFVDHDFDNLEETVRRMPRLITYIITGHFPPMNQYDDDLDYYDDEYIYNDLCNPSYRKWLGPKKQSHHPGKKLVVLVKIEDISDGKL